MQVSRSYQTSLRSPDKLSPFPPVAELWSRSSPKKLTEVERSKILTVYHSHKPEEGRAHIDMASTVSESGGVKVITQVLQATDPRAAQLMPCPSPTTSYPGSILVKDFRKAQPKALGSIQIVAGITQISFGIALTIAEASNPALTVTSGVYFWIGFLLTVSGSLLVETEKRDSASMGPNHGVNTVFILLCLLEMSTAIAALVYGCKAIRGENYTRMVL
ncbi:membrane-spanning 4-domains subfamily A member 4A isoform B [Alligator mississippiensis]|uniref:Membrane-spanning 4-domains subfamily A member 4A isoform B n=2 Tax=Alligator mississippiensis TaxID=8496 RepID=A0A151NXT1_ALLMI|nr:membrane-spanning 4-domains subfamily A member 4A isoform B [Alligator mississippiensis]